MNKHRAQEEIIAEMLSIIVNKAKKTHIMYKANLSYTLLCKYLDLLLSSNLVKYNRDDKIYELTKRGGLYLDHYAEYKIVENALINREAEFDDKRSFLHKMLGGD
jgi:predicted transcriptional regulator